MNVKKEQNNYGESNNNVNTQICKDVPFNPLHCALKHGHAKHVPEPASDTCRTWSHARHGTERVKYGFSISGQKSMIKGGIDGRDIYRIQLGYMADGRRWIFLGFGTCIPI